MILKMLFDATSYNRWVCPKIEFTINWLRSSTSHTTNLTKDMGSVSTCHRNYIYSGMRLQSHLLQKMYFLCYFGQNMSRGPKNWYFLMWALIMQWAIHCRYNSYKTCISYLCENDFTYKFITGKNNFSTKIGNSTYLLAMTKRLEKWIIILSSKAGIIN